MPYVQEDREWVEFLPDTHTDIILEKFWDKVKPNKNSPGFYRAHFYKGQRVDDQELVIFSASNTLHEKIMQSGAEVGATITVTRTGKGQTDTRWMVVVPIGNIDDERVALWEHGDPDPYDDAAPPAQTPAQQATQSTYPPQPPAPDATPPHQNNQKAPPDQQAQTVKAQGDPQFKVYVPKPPEHFNVQDIKAAEGAKRRLLAFEAIGIAFDHIFPKDSELTPGELLLKIEILGHLSAGTGVELSKAAYYDWETGPKLVLKEDVPGYTEPEPEPEPEVLTFQNDQEMLAALAKPLSKFFDVLATHEYFVGLDNLATVGAKKVANQFGFTHPSHVNSKADKLNVARMVWFYGDLMVKDKTKYSEYQSLLKTAKHFDYPEEVIDMSAVQVPPDVQTQNDVEDALNGDD